MRNSAMTNGSSPKHTSVRNTLVPFIEKYALDEGVTETEAYNVGYNNPSQFSREFKRQFGLPPSRAAEIL